MNFISMRSSLVSALFCGVVTFFIVSSAFADEERIKNYVSDIVIQEDASLVITETITVQAQGKNIKRGIFRDFPTKYQINGKNFNVGFELISIKRDGQNEAYYTEELLNGVRIYAGRSDYFLPHGIYSYQFIYKTTRQLTYLENVDELYWNVTGNGWDFPIDQVTANIHLPGGAEAVQSSGYTGFQGDKGTSYKSENRGSVLSFVTTDRLDREEGLTIAVSWPKGFVTVPDSYEQAQYFLEDNFAIFVGLASLGIMTTFYLIVWYSVGLDPETGIIIPLFSAPKGISPAAVGFVLNSGFRKGYDENTAFISALTSLAAKGYITINQESDDYRLKRCDVGNLSSLPNGEKKILEGLMSEVGEEFILKRQYDSAFSIAYDHFVDAVSDEYKMGYYAVNTGKWLFGFLIGAVGVIMSLIYQVGELVIPILFFMMITGIFSGVILPSFCQRVIGALSGYGFSKDISTLFSFSIFLLIPLFSLFIAEEITGEVLPIEIYSIVMLIFAVILLFRHLLEAPTIKGRKIMDEIEGYKHYLSVAEQDRLVTMGKEPEFTEKLFEQHLAFAMALDVEDQWTERLNSYLVSMNRSPSQYQPDWYNGSSRPYGTGYGNSNLVSEMRSGISRSISAASTPPSSSSSGSSGGSGFSGGGGGGGGGGGW